VTKIGAKRGNRPNIRAAEWQSFQQPAPTLQSLGKAASGSQASACFLYGQQSSHLGIDIRAYNL